MKVLCNREREELYARLKSKFNLEWHHCRYYQVPAKDKSVEQCASHGRDHKAYGWSPQIDPWWSDEQIDAYMTAYRNMRETLSGMELW